MVKLEQIKNQVAGWVDDRAAKPGAAPVAEALAFMLATLRENTFETPKRWTTGKKLQVEQETTAPENRLTLEAAAGSYLTAVRQLNHLPTTHEAANPNSDVLLKTIEATAHRTASSVNWPLYTAKLDVCPALFPDSPRNPGERVSQTVLLMTIGSNDMMSTETIPMPLSMILHLLPLLPGSEFTPTDIGTAIDHLDKLRMNEELDRCYDALEQNLEYYHPVNPVNPGLECYRTVQPTSADTLPPQDDGYRPASRRSIDFPARWQQYNKLVREHRFNCMDFGPIDDMDERIPEDHPYVTIVNELYWNPKNSDSLKRPAGDYYHRLLTENLHRMTTAALAHIEAVLGVRYDT